MELHIALLYKTLYAEKFSLEKKNDLNIYLRFVLFNPKNLYNQNRLIHTDKKK